MMLRATEKRATVRAMRIIAGAALLLLCGCPPSALPCADDTECNDGEACVVGAGGGTCQPIAAPTDAGVLVDAGNDAGELVDGGEPDAGQPDGGVRDDGLAVRGTLEVAPGEMRSGTKALRGRVLGVAPATTLRGGTLILDAAVNGAPP